MIDAKAQDFYKYGKGVKFYRVMPWNTLALVSKVNGQRLNVPLFVLQDSENLLRDTEQYIASLFAKADTIGVNGNDYCLHVFLTAPCQTEGSGFCMIGVAIVPSSQYVAFHTYFSKTEGKHLILNPVVIEDTYTSKER
jgi:hypothetical protein